MTLFDKHKAETCSLCKKPLLYAGDRCHCDDPIGYALMEEDQEPPIVITTTAQEVFCLRALIADALQQLQRFAAMEEASEAILSATELLQTALYGDFGICE